MRTFLCLAIALTLVGGAFAELQNVEVYGRIDVRCRYYRSSYNDAVVFGGGPARQVRIPAMFLPGRALGEALGVTSIMDHDDRGSDWGFTELVTTLGVKADLTNNVGGVIEFMSFDRWGTDFRSDYITAADFVTTTGDDLEVLQSYIDINEFMDQPLRIRIGRQRMRFDDGWLISDRATPTLRISWDGVRATYDVDDFEVDAFYAKLAESGPIEQDGDVDMYGLRAAYKALEPIDIAAYWYWVRDARSVSNTNLTWFPELIEDIFDVDDYDPTNLHTVGIHAWGAMNAFDYNLQVAYQFGDADAIGSRFVPIGGVYGDDGAEFDKWAADLELGYSFDCAWKPRVYLGGCWFEGEDNRDESFWDWLNPFDRPQASVSFNRLFSETNYAGACNDNGWMSNFKAIRGGVVTHPFEKVMVKLQLQQMWVDETFAWPAYFTVGDYRIPIAPKFGFWTEEGSDNLGLEATSIIKYDYSDNLSIMLYYTHLFSGDAMQDGAYSYFNGNSFMGGTDDDDVDYVFLWFILNF